MSMNVAIENLKNAINAQRRIDGKIIAYDIQESEIQDTEKLWHEFAKRGSVQSRKARKVLI